MVFWQIFLQNGGVSLTSTDRSLATSRLTRLRRDVRVRWTHGISPALPRRDIPRRERFVWRARVRANPATHMAYRVAVAVLGGLFIVAAGLTGWLPGPGGIPLFLAGMAILASEFRWAHSLTIRAMTALRAFGRLSRRTKLVVIGGFFVCVALLGYGALLIVGAPQWLPEGLRTVLTLLPGVRG